MGSVIVVYQTSIDLEGAVNDHIDDDLPPFSMDLTDDVKAGLKGSGSFGMSYYLLFPTPIIMFMSIILSIDIGRDREPTKKDIENGFFRN